MPIALSASAQVEAMALEPPLPLSLKELWLSFSFVFGCWLCWLGLLFFEALDLKLFAVKQVKHFIVCLPLKF